MKFYLNEQEIKVLNGANFSIQKDETLDNGKIELVLTENKDPIKPMTDLRIVDNEETYNFVVMSDTVEIASKKPECYKHTLEFVQNTKKFSKIQVRNTQFSQPAKNSLKCGCNATFLNVVGTTGYMQNLVYSRFGETLNNEYSYSMEISQRHKVKGAHFKINTYWYKNATSSQSGLEKHYQDNLQDTCPKLFICYDVYKDGKFQYEKDANYSNGDIDYIISNLGNGVYTIKNIRVGLLSDTTKYSENDLFIVNISLIADVYYYSLYDVLDTLRKQIALEEGLYNSIVNPVISYTSEGSGYKITLKNNNPYECYVYYKFWDRTEEDEPTSYLSEELNSYSSFTYGKLFEQTRLMVKAYLIKKDSASLSSDIVESYKFIPPISYEFKLYTNDYGKDKEEKYKLVLEEQYMIDSDFTTARNGWQYIEEKGLFDISEYTFDEEKSTFKKDKFTLYGYQTLELVPPSIYTALEYNASSSGYNIKVRFMNPNTKKCKIYWYAEGSVVKDKQYLANELDAGGSYEFTMATITTDSSGKIYAKCEFEELASDYASSNWIYSTGGLVQPYISCTQYGNEYTYQFTIKQLEENGTLYYRYKLLSDTWSDYQTVTDESVSFVLSNTTTMSKIAYIEAYTTKDTKTSETSILEQKIQAGAVIKEPKISYIVINDYTETITIENQATQSDAVIYYKVIKNNVDPIDYSVYTGSFQIKADAGSTDTYKIFAYVHSKSAEGSSSVATYETTLYGELNLVMPTINVRSEYNSSSSSSYNIYVSFINNNKITADVYWYSTGTFATSSKTISNVGAGETSEEYLLGVSTSSSDKGIVYANTKSGNYRSDTNSEEWIYAGPVYYTLTVKYVGVGLSETTTEQVLSGTIINPNSYIKSYSGYKYSSISPTTNFTMLSDTTITINYLVGGTLNSPVFSEYSQDTSDVVFKVTNTNSDIVTLYYVINPSSVPTSASDIIDATDHYTITSISTSATESLPWGSDTSLTIYGVFGSTSHSTTYDDSDVSSITLYKNEPAELSAPSLSLVSSTSTDLTISVYNPNYVSVRASDNVGNSVTIGSRSSDTFKYAWSGSETSKTIRVTFSKSGYTSASASKTFTRPSITYVLTVKYYKGGVQYSSTTKNIEEGNKISISDYEISISGYKFERSNPTSDFYMTDNKTLEMYYVVSATYDWYFYNTVVWDSSFTEKSGDSTLLLTLKSSSMGSDYESTAVYSVYDQTLGVQLDDDTRGVYIINSTSETYTLAGDTTHNNASSIIANRGSK